jgi:hypothetical protein
MLYVYALRRNSRVLELRLKDGALQEAWNIGNNEPLKARESLGR